MKQNTRLYQHPLASERIRGKEAYNPFIFTTNQQSSLRGIHGETSNDGATLGLSLG